MPRKQHARELTYGRVRQWELRMSDKKTVPGYVGTLDMQDPESIRRYVADVIAMTTEPSIASLKRLEMLTEMADRLEARATHQAPVVSISLEQARAASAELMRRKQSG